ncbi:MAG: surE 2 [Armatimonadetes bacterium]|nr:surE 2 [Armatimonadota bacterium]
MKLLLTNDDGLDAVGLAALQQACSFLGDVVVVAPNGCRSYIGHQVTARRPLRVVSHGPGRFSVDGTPADCVRLALTHLAPDVDLVVSGINHGANLGVDLYTSGTAAAAREAAFFGLPAIAISHYKARDLEFDWDWAARQAARVIASLADRGCRGEHFWNVNLPHTAPAPEWAEVCVAPVDPSRQDVRFTLDGDAYTYSGQFHERPRRDGHDVALCLGGKVTVSLVTICACSSPEDTASA